MKQSRLAALLPFLHGFLRSVLLHEKRCYIGSEMLSAPEMVLRFYPF